MCTREIATIEYLRKVKKANEHEETQSYVDQESPIALKRSGELRNQTNFDDSSEGHTEVSAKAETTEVQLVKEDFNHEGLSFIQKQRDPTNKSTQDGDQSPTSNFKTILLRNPEKPIHLSSCNDKNDC